MKDAEDEAFDELAKRQGSWGGGFQAKRAAAADKINSDFDEVIIDYEKALRDAHEAVLEQNLDLAMTKAMDAIIAARLMYGALRHMKEKNEMSNL